MIAGHLRVREHVAARMLTCSLALSPACRRCAGLPWCLAGEAGESTRLSTWRRRMGVWRRMMFRSI
jgi:hypothetical protein